MADQGVDEGRPPGWYPGATPNEQLQWDGQRFTARRRWVHSSWVDVPLEDPGRERRPTPGPGKQDHRWSATTVILLVVALAGLGAVIYAVASGVNSAPTPKSTSAATTVPAGTTTPTSASIQQGSAAEVAACQSDARTVDTAVQAYMAEHGTYPSPPSPWSAASYAANFAPLTASGGGGPFMQTPPGTTFYVIEYDAAGHVWVAPPGSYQVSYNRGQDFDLDPDICTAAVG